MVCDGAYSRCQLRIAIPLFLVLLSLIASCGARRQTRSELSGVREATWFVQELINSVRSQVENKMGRSYFDEYTAHSYKVQVVAGINYFVKVRIGNNDFIHLRVHVPLSHYVPTLVAVQEGMTESDPIVHIPFRN